MALAKFGTVVRVVRETHRGMPDVETGTRRVTMEMDTPVPNHLWVRGVRVLCNYAGMVRRCIRCGEADHVVRDCRADRCEQCGKYGHSAVGCPRRDREGAGVAPSSAEGGRRRWEQIPVDGAVESAPREGFPPLSQDARAAESVVTERESAGVVAVGEGQATPVEPAVAEGKAGAVAPVEVVLGQEERPRTVGDEGPTVVAVQVEDEQPAEEREKRKEAAGGASLSVSTSCSSDSESSSSSESCSTCSPGPLVISEELDAPEPCDSEGGGEDEGGTPSGDGAPNRPVTRARATRR